MKTKKALFGIFIAGIFALIFGGKSYATAGNTVEISGGKTWNICISASASYDGSVSVVNITKSGFATQLALGNDECKVVTLETGSYAANLSSAIGAGATSYEVSEDTLTFSADGGVRKYINAFGSINYTIDGSGESPFDLLFSMPGECQFNGNANVSGDTCKDGDGNPLTNKKYIDTNVALFSEENAGRDFEVYFTLTDYAETQPQNQATLFNAKYENSSMYYPGFTLRTLSNNGDTLQLTGRYGKDNTDADKANIDISGTSIKGKEVKIVRVDGMVSYSIDGGEMIPFQDYKNFSRYFNQTAVFGASMQTNGSPQRYYDGTIKDIRVYLKKVTTASIVFDANGGTGTMAAIRNIEVGANVTLPANTYTLQNAVFAGWNTKADGTGAAYINEAIVVVSAIETIRLYAQWNGGVAVLDSGENVNKKLKELAGTDVSEDGVYSIDNTIKAIRVANTLPSGFDTSSQNNIISASKTISPVPIYAWFDGDDSDGDGEGDNVIFIFTRASKIKGGANMGNMFSSFRSLSDISALASWDTSGVTDMSWMFDGAASIPDLSPLASWDTSNVTNMCGTFRSLVLITNVDALRTIRHDGKDYVSWDTSNVTSMHAMFSSVRSLTDVSALASWDTSSVTEMSFMFVYCESLADISALASWNTSSLTTMRNMFGRDTSLVSVGALKTERHEGKDYVSWDVSNVTDMGDTFYGATSLVDISALGSWDTSSVITMRTMFYGATSLVDISALGSWNVSSVTGMTEMFRGASSLANISGLSSWDVSNVSSMSRMFHGATSLLDVSELFDWNISDKYVAYEMFYGVPATPLPSWYEW